MTDGNCDVVVVHYSEIGIKGKNRAFFERILAENVKKSLGPYAERVYRMNGRIVCEIENNNREEVTARLSLIPGVSNFLFARKVSPDVDEIKRNALDTLGKMEFDSFRVTTSRTDKEFKVTSQELNEIVGEHIVKNTGKKVKLKNPDVELYIEVCKNEIFIGYKRCRGIGGLPVGSSGKLICSLSGGIDSPVAGFLMMKRGCRVVFVHMYNSLKTNANLVRKIEEIVDRLNGVQLYSKLYIVPFAEIQKEIIASVPARYRMIIYRRFMFRIINEIGKKEGAKGVITGDSIGQVASQTVENLSCIYEVCNLPVFTPLIGMNKEEIVSIARKIRTYEISIKPYPDCCSLMIAKHPETRANMKEIRRFEENIKNARELVEKCVSNSKVMIFRRN